MSNDTELREEIKRIIRQTDPSAEELRAVANDLEETADKWDELDETL